MSALPAHQKPNLFALATKELSQDAFIAWLLQWADPKNAVYNKELTACAKAFVSKLASLQSTPPAEIRSVVAGRQWNHIDIWAEVNEELLLIIEDKTYTGQHSNQLKNYRDGARQWCDERGWRLACIYLKTGSESLASLKKVQDEGYAIFRRKDILDSLQGWEIDNAIFVDFKERLQALEVEENQYLDKPIGEWNGADWRGFYQDLEERRPIWDWKLVNPPGGASFLAAVLNWNNFEDHCPYMQIEQGPLCYKIGEVYENRSQVRNDFHHRFMNQSEDYPEIRRPGRFGKGTYMTVASVDRRDWLGKDDQFVDMQAVTERIYKYEQLLLDFIESESAS